MNGIYEASANVKAIHGGWQIKTAPDPIHWHEGIELIYITKSSCKILNGSEIIKAEKGDLVVINSEDLHTVMCDQDAKTPGEYICYIMKHEFCDEMGFNITENIVQKKLRDDRVDEIFAVIEKEIHQKLNYQTESIKISLLQVLLILFRDYISDSYVEQKKSDKIKLTKKTVKFIRKNFNKSITMEDIENHCGYSRFYLSRIFKDVTSKTIISYLNEVRVDKSKDMLRTTAMSINEIALNCGFESQSYFGKVFKKHTGCSPVEYRAKF